MKKNFFLLFIIVVISSGSAQTDWQIRISNPNPFTVDDYLISAELYEEIAALLELSPFILTEKDSIIPTQVIYSRGKYQLVFSTHLKPGGEKSLMLKTGEGIVVPEYKPRVYSELSMKPEENYDGKMFRGQFYKVDAIKVPPVHKDHDALFKYEGPGWESEKVGYRFYLDWRNANDIFGKKVNELVLENTGVNDTIAKDDSYHNMQSWGMDIFKVGNTLGIGSIGMMLNDSIYMVSETDSTYFGFLNNGPLYTEFVTIYFGWRTGEEKYDLRSEMSIGAGSRLTSCNIKLKGDAPNITTGLAKYAGTEFFRGSIDGQWSYIALYGKQSLSSPDDQLGIAVLFRNSDVIQQSENDLNYYVLLKPRDSAVNYYFCAAWDKEPGGIKNISEFRKYLDETVRILNNPPKAEILSIEKSNE